MANDNTVNEKWINELAITMEVINDKALESAMLEFCDGWVDSDSPEWEEYGDQILECQEEYFEEDLEEHLTDWMQQTGITAEEIAQHLRAHQERLIDLLRLGRYRLSLDQWLEGFIENHALEDVE